MKILLDTHTFLWWIADSGLLSPRAREIFSDGGNELIWSAASSWEVAIKYRLGKLPLPQEPSVFIADQLALNRVDSLAINDQHAFASGKLPTHHRDPFDRMLVAQARLEEIPLLTNDRQISRYDVLTEW